MDTNRGEIMPVYKYNDREKIYPRMTQEQYQNLGGYNDYKNTIRDLEQQTIDNGNPALYNLEEGYPVEVERQMEKARKNFSPYSYATGFDGIDAGDWGRYQAIKFPANAQGYIREGDDRVAQVVERGPVYYQNREFNPAYQQSMAYRNRAILDREEQQELSDRLYQQYLQAALAGEYID